MYKFIFASFIVAALAFSVYGENLTDTTWATMMKLNTTIGLTSNSVNIVVKCRDKNSLLTNIMIDNSGSVKMSNSEEETKLMESPIYIEFETCREQTVDVSSFFKSFSTDLLNTDNLFNFYRSSFFRLFGKDTKNETESKTEDSWTNSWSDRLPKGWK